MSDSDYVLSFFGLLLGLTVAEVAIKLADAIDAHKRRPVGWLTPLLAGFVLLDITSFWMWVWSVRNSLKVEWDTVFGGLIIAICYFLSAALVFPRTSEWASLDEHYWVRKRFVVAGVLFANVSVLGFVMGQRLLPEWNDTWFFVWQGAYYVPLVALLFSRRRKIDLALLIFVVLVYLVSASPLLPGSNWGNAIGLGAE